MAKRIESKRSNQPPWPGKKLPLSFTLTLRFTIDSTKSPSVPLKLTTMANPIQLPIVEKFASLKSGMKLIPIAVAIVRMSEIPNPSQVFFGDIRSIILCFPKSEPPQ